MPETLGASFSIDITDLKAGLTQANRLIRESESEFKAAAAGMDDWTESQEGLEARIKHLNKATDLQSQKVDALKKQYQENIKNGLDPMSASMVQLRTNINKEEAALNKNEKELRQQKEALKDLGKEADKAADDVKNLGDEAEKSGDGFTIAGGAIAGFISNGLSALVSSIGNAVSSMANLAESTREYREDIGKLQTAFETAGLSSELATKSYKDLYAVLGEEDRTVEAVNHLAKFVETEEEMAQWTKILTGVWGTFGDSLPIEGLTEASNEVIRNGQLTGVLTDAINWAAKAGETFGVKLKASTEANEEWNKAVKEATTAEEYFNLALQECSDEQERQELITKTLNGLYSEAATNYEKNNESIMEARRASSDYTDTLAELGEKVEPVTNKVTVGFNKLLQKALELVNKVDFDKFGRKVDKAFEKISEEILPAVIDGFKWIKDNSKSIEKGLTFALGIFTGVKLYQGITRATGAFKTMFAAVKAFTMSNPIGLIAAGVGLLAGAVVTLTAREKLQNEEMRKSVKQAEDSAEAMRDRVDSFNEMKEASVNVANEELNHLGHLKLLNEELGTLADENGKVKEGYEGRAQFILNELNEALGTEYNMNQGIITSYKEMQTEIDNLMKKQEAEILLNSKRDAYEEAVVKKNEARQAVIDATIAKEEQQNKVHDARIAYLEKEKEFYDLIEQGRYAEAATAKNEADDLLEIYNNEKEALDKRVKAYEEAQNLIDGYTESIAQYEKAQSMVLSGKTDEAIEYLRSTEQAYKDNNKAFEEASVEYARQLEQNAIEARLWADERKRQYREGVEGASKEAVDEAEKAALDAQNEWEKVGKAIIQGTGEGIEDSYSLLQQYAYRFVDKAADDALNYMDQRLEAGTKARENEFVGPNAMFIPQMATGGVVRSATNAIIGEAGAEAVLPLERNTGWMDMLADKLSARMGTTKGTGSVNVYQTNNYSQAHSRYEIFKSKEATAKAVKLALREV